MAVWLFQCSPEVALVARCTQYTQLHISQATSVQTKYVKQAGRSAGWLVQCTPEVALGVARLTNGPARRSPLIAPTPPGRKFLKIFYKHFKSCTDHAYQQISSHVKLPGTGFIEKYHPDSRCLENCQSATIHCRITWKHANLSKYIDSTTDSISLPIQSAQWLRNV